MTKPAGRWPPGPPWWQRGSRITTPWQPAVKELDAARAYYEGTLGFAPAGDSPGGAPYTAGSTRFLVYSSAFAGTSRSTAGSA